jgi:hypothetical protein
MAQEVTISALMFRMQAELWFPEIGARNLRARQMQPRSEASLRALLNRALTRTLGSGPLHTAFEDMHDAKLPSDVTL